MLNLRSFCSAEARNFFKKQEIRKTKDHPKELLRRTENHPARKSPIFHLNANKRLRVPASVGRQQSYNYNDG